MKEAQPKIDDIKKIVHDAQRISNQTTPKLPGLRKQPESSSAVRTQVLKPSKFEEAPTHLKVAKTIKTEPPSIQANPFFHGHNHKPVSSRPNVQKEIASIPSKSSSAQVFASKSAPRPISSLHPSIPPLKKQPHKPMHTERPQKPKSFEGMANYLFQKPLVNSQMPPRISDDYQDSLHLFERMTAMEREVVLKATSSRDSLRFSSKVSSPVLPAPTLPPPPRHVPIQTTPKPPSSTPSKMDMPYSNNNNHRPAHNTYTSNSGSTFSAKPPAPKHLPKLLPRPPPSSTLPPRINSPVSRPGTPIPTKPRTVAETTITPSPLVIPRTSISSKPPKSPLLSAKKPLASVIETLTQKTVSKIVSPSSPKTSNGQAPFPFGAYPLPSAVPRSPQTASLPRPDEVKVASATPPSAAAPKLPAQQETIVTKELANGKDAPDDLTIVHKLTTSGSKEQKILDFIAETTSKMKNSLNS